VIDLHTHTTASDGLLGAPALVREAWLAGIRVLGVTDHDTVASLEDARRACDAFGLTLVDGIEVTAVDDGRDVHVLAYFVDSTSPSLLRHLADQREARRERLRRMAARLAAAGVPVEVDRLFATLPPGRALGRPALAEALIAAGHVRTAHDAFERWLGVGRPGWVPREGPTVSEVVDLIHDAGGLAALAHPVLYGRDDEIPGWRERGLDALEVYHSEHAAEDAERYRALATRLDLLVTGGSDYHGEPRGRTSRGRVRLLGRIGLPDQDFERLLDARPRRTSDATRAQASR
jgi:predicted metal-dependent phosphoesterase TrpH